MIFYHNFGEALKQVFTYIIYLVVFSLFANVPHVFDEDNRELVDQAHFKGLHSKVAYLSSGCTGAFVSENVIITAAHCVLDTTKDVASRKDITVYLERDMNNFSQALKPVGVYVDRNYKENPSFSNDFAMIVVNVKRKNDKYFSLSSDNFFFKSVGLAGFSSDLKGKLGVDRECTVRNSNKARGYLYHDCDSTGGASGGPLYHCENEVCSIFAIHIAESIAKGNSYSLSDGVVNVALSLNKYKEEIELMIEESQALLHE